MPAPATGAAEMQWECGVHSVPVQWGCSTCSLPMPPFCYLGSSPKKTNAQLFNILLMISNKSLQERGHQTQPGKTIWHSAVSCSGYPPQYPGM